MVGTGGTSSFIRNCRRISRPTNSNAQEKCGSRGTVCLCLANHQVMQTLRCIQAQQYALFTSEFYDGGRQASCSPGIHSPYPSETRHVSSLEQWDFWVIQSVVKSQYWLKCSRLRLKRDGTRAETRFRLSAKRTSPFKSAGVSVQSTTGSRGVRISGSNAGCTMFRGSMKCTGYPLHSPVSPSLPLPCFTVCHHISTGL